jgi:cyclopropane fatty-acyl-phospholipid synthase-like methyltransferase
MVSLGATVSYYAAAAQPPATSSEACLSNGPANSIGAPLDSLSLKFVIWAQEAGGLSLDICGDGTATLALLARGGHVVALDSDAAALHRLVERAPTQQCRRLKVRLGQLPAVDFKAANFAAIHAARVLHFLDPVAIEYSLRKFYRWLYPEGRLFVSVLTPTGARRAASRTSSGPPICPLDERMLRREISAAGFFVEDASTYLPSWEGSQECCAVIARCTS